jgi:hypothetical protein
MDDATALQKLFHEARRALGTGGTATLARICKDHGSPDGSLSRVTDTAGIETALKNAIAIGNGATSADRTRAMATSLDQEAIMRNWNRPKGRTA